MIIQEQLSNGVLNLLPAKRKTHYELIILDRVCIYLASKLSLKTQLQLNILTAKGYLHMQLFLELFLVLLWMFYFTWVSLVTNSFISWVLFILVGIAVTYWGRTTYDNICKKDDDAKNPIKTVSVEPTATKISTRKVEPSQENNFDYESYSNGHSEKAWRNIGLKVSTKYKTTAKKNYTFKEVESSNSLRYLHLTKNQRKVKILGDALVKNTKSKRRARDILISQYSFKNNTAEYAVGYEGYNDW
ncbi:hypothetical protein H4J58_13240 [Colwellia sp. MB3u-70]|uniref:hypothetical protein n=1 Tax=unclassified Colwellia TaxID=196834 RepID=UPI0015F3A4B7|nr:MULTISPECIES: hypothetical protein [unclassified Colwellia]MBA6292838.1 hypothetical protein [Colwellia sp. MB3u-8]MBA6308078.1 hypothetical protein [Colwellia sp. MB3u-70]